MTLINLLNGLMQLAQVFSLFILLCVMFYFIRYSCRYMLMRMMGWKSLYITAWIGTPVHEISHMLLCPIFQQKIESFSLLSMDSETGTLGYVNRSYRESLWTRCGNFFIGIAPIFGGLLAIYLLTLFLQPHQLEIYDAAYHLVQDANGGALNFNNVFEVFVQWQANIEFNLPFFVWLYLCTCISIHMIPSVVDIKGGLPGLLVFSACWIVFSVIFNEYHAIAIDWLDEFARKMAAQTIPLLFTSLLYMAIITVSYTALRLLRKPRYA